MKLYDKTMENLHFREDFCEETIEKAQQSKQVRKFPKPLMAAACICLCCALLFTTAWAVSPAFRNFFIQTEHAQETISLPQDAGSMIENSVGAIEARYYKLDGKLAAYEGFGSLLPVEKDGVMTYYALAEDGSLVKAEPIRSIEKTLEYKGHVFDLNMDIYGGDKPTAVMGDMAIPLANEHSYTIWCELQKGITSPLRVNLDTFEITDPMENISFTLPQNASHAYVSVTQNASALLVHCPVEDGVQYYHIDAKTAEITLLEGAGWFICGDSIYHFGGGTLSKLNEALEKEVLVENCAYMVGTEYVTFCEGENLVALEIRTQNRYVIENGAERFGNQVFISATADKTKIKLANLKLGNGLDTDAIGIVDLTRGTMFSLERNAAMHEEMGGWFDNDRFLLAGTIGNEWYICMYEIG